MCKVVTVPNVLIQELDSAMLEVDYLKTILLLLLTRME